MPIVSLVKYKNLNLIFLRMKINLNVLQVSGLSSLFLPVCYLVLLYTDVNSIDLQFTGSCSSIRFWFYITSYLNFGLIC